VGTPSSPRLRILSFSDTVNVGLCWTVVGDTHVGGVSVRVIFTGLALLPVPGDL